MGPLRIAEIRGAWVTWVAVSLTFIATGFAVTLPLLVVSSLNWAADQGLLVGEDVLALQVIPWFNLFLVVLAALSVVGAATGLVIEARRPAIARIALAGATPRQVQSLLMSQLSVIAAAGAVVGDLLAVVMLRPTMTLLLGNRGIDGVIPLSINPVQVVIGTVVAVALALLGGWRQARRASQIPPVEALRPTESTGRGRRRFGRWIAAGLVLVAAIAMGGPIVAAATSAEMDAGSIIMQGALAEMLLVGTMFAMAAPLAIGLLTRAWTALIPARVSASWHLARHTVIARRERLARSVTPVMFAVGVMLGISSIGAATSRALQNVGREALGQATIGDLVTMVGLVLMISIAGGLSSLVMMSRQRSAELALAGIVGATPRQQVLTGVFEAVIITVTATILGTVMALSGVLILYFGLDALGMPGGFAFDGPAYLGTLVVCFLVTAAATTLPSLPSLRRPAPAVIARLVAE